MVARVCLVHHVALDVDDAGILHCPADPAEAVTRWGVVSAEGEMLAIGSLERIVLGPRLAGAVALLGLVRRLPCPGYRLTLPRRPLPQAA